VKRSVLQNALIIILLYAILFELFGGHIGRMAMAAADKSLKALNYNNALFFTSAALLTGLSPNMKMAAYDIRTVAFRGIGKYKKSRESMSKVIEIARLRSDKALYRYYLRNANICIYSGDFDAAQNYLDICLPPETEKGNWEIENAVLNMKRGDVKAALENIRNAEKMSTTRRFLISERARIYIQTGRYSEAIADLDDLALDSKGMDWINREKASIYYEQGDLKKALVQSMEIKSGVKDRYEYLQALEIRLLVYQELHDVMASARTVSEAAAAAAEYRKKDPYCSYCLTEVSDIYNDAGVKPEQALKLAQSLEEDEAARAMVVMLRKCPLLTYTPRLGPPPRAPFGLTF